MPKTRAPLHAEFCSRRSVPDQHTWAARASKGPSKTLHVEQTARRREQGPQNAAMALPTRPRSLDCCGTP
eukprot:7251041-Alexandrium_andersonii.AAC.1